MLLFCLIFLSHTVLPTPIVLCLMLTVTMVSDLVFILKRWNQKPREVKSFAQEVRPEPRVCPAPFQVSLSLLLRHLSPSHPDSTPPLYLASLALMPPTFCQLGNALRAISQELSLRAMIHCPKAALGNIDSLGTGRSSG